MHHPKTANGHECVRVLLLSNIEPGVPYLGNVSRKPSIISVARAFLDDEPIQTLTPLLSAPSLNAQKEQRVS